MSDSSTGGRYRCEIHGIETDSRARMKQHIEGHPGGAARDRVDEFLTDKSELANLFNEKNGTTLYEQALKLSEEEGEVAEAVLGLSGDLLFKEPTTTDDVADELADLITTGYYVADLAGVGDLDDRILSRLQANLSRNSRSQDTEGSHDG